MPIVLGNDTITGLGVGGLPNGTVNADDLANGAVTAAKMGYAGAVLQVVTAVKTDTYGTSTLGWSDITSNGIPLACTITPRYSTSKILILAQITVGTDSGNLWAIRLLRNSTLINFGDASGSAGQGIRNAGYRETNSQEMVSVAFLDSPGTTSATTYKFQNNTESGYAFYLNRTANSINDTRQARSSSNIILMEIAQ
jgi:hypothetical protein